MTGKVPQSMSYDQRSRLTRAIMTILDGWGMTATQQIAILNLPPKTPTRVLRRYRDNTPFPETPEVEERLEHIVGIADALRTTYPHNPPMGSIWIRQKNKRFQGYSPLAILLEQGLGGVVRVRAHLDCTYDWFES